MKRILSLLLVAMLLISIVPTAFADTPDYLIDTSRTGSISIYKIDFTNARKDGVWDENSFLSTGWKESYVEDTLINNATRKGAASGDRTLGNGSTGKGYAVPGVEFSYVKVANIVTLSETDAADVADVQVLYQISKTDAILPALGLLNGANAYTPAADAELDTVGYYYYTSDTLNAALSSRINDNATTAKNTMESYVAANGGTAMPLTDEYGHSTADGLALGLYILVETKVPEEVTSTVNPFFISLPMTTVSGDANSESPEGGHQWNYDVTVYPKNETGIPTLEKAVRESKADTGKNTGSDSITDGFQHNATASAGDTLEYQIVSTLPSITSQATNLSTYNFYDTLAAGLSYDQAKGVQIDIFRDTNCTDRVAVWQQGSGKFTVNYSQDGHAMTVDISADGLASINGNPDANASGALYRGFSGYTLRVTYAAKINSNTSFVFGEAGNRNKVVLTWKRSSSTYYDTLVDDSHVYSFGLNLTKKFSNQASDDADKAGKFQHVKFRIFNKTDGYYLTASLNEAEGIYYVTGHTDVEKNATIFTPVKSGSDYGKIIVLGVEDDEYVISELETANGYTLLKEPITMKISAADNLAHCGIYSEDILGVVQNDARYAFGDVPLANIPQKAMDHVGYSVTASVDGNKVTMKSDDSSANAAAALTIVNTPGLDLPQTGDVGTWMYGTFGGIGMAIAIVVIFFALKKKRA